MEHTNFREIGIRQMKLYVPQNIRFPGNPHHSPAQRSFSRSIDRHAELAHDTFQSRQRA